MRNSRQIMLALGLAQALAAGSAALAQTPPDGRSPVGPAVYTLPDGYLQWPVTAAGQPYTSIDGKKLHGYVEEATAISRRYRDAGHQLWGRLEGTASDEESAKWFADKLRAAGAEVRMQPLDLPPQWLPASWDVTASSGGQTFKLKTAQPSTRSVGTPDGKTLDLELVYVGLGEEADFAGRDVRGKAVVIYAMPQPGVWGNSSTYTYSTTRARDKGAAVVIEVMALPGNIMTQYAIFREPPGPPSATRQPNIPGFTLGLQDGDALRRMIETAPAGQPAHVKVSLDAKPVAGLKTQLVWGEIPGNSDEKITIVAHRDSWFEGAGDNASGMATAIGLAQYFAAIPKAKRGRTIEIVGSSGHHGTQVGVQWMADHPETLAKTALVINAEHTSLTQQIEFAGHLRPANRAAALHWAFIGSPKLSATAIEAFKTFGVATYTGTDGVAHAEISPLRSTGTALFGVIDVDTLYHSDHETADAVPWTGLGDVTRAFAKMIVDLEKYKLTDLKPDPSQVPPKPTTPRAAEG